MKLQTILQWDNEYGSFLLKPFEFDIVVNREQFARINPELIYKAADKFDYIEIQRDRSEMFCRLNTVGEIISVVKQFKNTNVVSDEILVKLVDKNKIIEEILRLQSLKSDLELWEKLK